MMILDNGNDNDNYAYDNDNGNGNDNDNNNAIKHVRSRTVHTCIRNVQV